LLQGCRDGFLVDQYLKQKRSFTKPVLAVNAYAGKSTQAHTKSPHPELYKLLRQKRDRICEEKTVPVYLVAGSATLEEMALYLPQTVNELNQISGFGPAKTKQYGDAFLSIIIEYCALHDLHTNIEAKPIKIKRSKKAAEIKTDTKNVSFNLFKEGKTIEQIALNRNMTIGTIESHLSYFVGLGEIDISTIVSSSKLEQIKSSVEKFGLASTKEIKESLPEHFTYGEIRMVVASLKSFA
jgi:hypothetical protein